jgi:arylsulfatase A-like enzyme
VAARYPSVHQGLWADVGRAIAMATGGALAFAPVEYALTLATYVGTSTFASKLRLIALVATLSLVLWLLLALAMAGLLVAARIVHAQLDPEGARGPGLFVASPLERGIRAGVPKLWAAIVALIGAGATVDRGALWAIQNFKEQQLIAGLIAAFAVAAMLFAVVLYRVLAFAIRAGGEGLAPLVGPANTLGRWRAAGVAFAGMIGGGMGAVWAALPQSRSVIPVRSIVAAIVVALGMGLGLYVRYHAPKLRPEIARIGAAIIVVCACGVLVWRADMSSAIALSIALVTGGAIARFVWRAPRDRRTGLRIAGGTLVLLVGTFLWWGADLETRYMALTASEPLEKLVGVVHVANDVDRDGFGSLLGEVDCAPFDSKIHPGAVDTPDDGIDQDCDGEDLKMSDLLAPPPGPKVTIPDRFKKPWNVLLITIDDLRYDRTTFGGYAKQEKHRDTTPNLSKLVARSTTFDWCQAPAAGTMASIPAILTSKFFHSGIALDEDHNPPKIRPENVILPEIMKGAGYYTGVIGSHDWWNDWGLDQGVDEYDNSIGKTPDAFRVAADKVTNHILAWISRNQGRKWFMWAHYIDPHGRYVAHPDVVDWGNEEPDLYDAEIKWTDQEVGRLLDRMLELPSTANTIIIITSDHGDSMAEHTVPLGTHGTALYRELLHVPMIFYIPDAKPRAIRGAVTNLDILPTMAALAGIPIDDLEPEGRSLVGALFYGREDRERIVFAETNAPDKQRAAISEKWKLIYYLSSNVYELFDLTADDWEKTNLAPKHPPEMEPMRRALQGWMDRVLYAHDPLFNQAYRRIAEVVLRDPPAPEVAARDQRLADGRIEILGIGRDPATPIAPGAKVDVFVYFRVVEPATVAYRFQLVGWAASPGAPLDAPVAPSAMRSGSHVTADGAYPTDRWRKGELIRERFTLALPADWRDAALSVGLYAVDIASAQPARPTGAAPANEPMLFPLGALPARQP